MNILMEKKLFSILFCCKYRMGTVVSKAMTVSSRNKSLFKTKLEQSGSLLCHPSLEERRKAEHRECLETRLNLKIINNVRDIRFNKLRPAQYMSSYQCNKQGSRNITKEKKID